MSGDGKLKVREEIGDYIQKVTTIPLPSSSAMPIIDYEVSTECFIFLFSLLIYLCCGVKCFNFLSCNAHGSRYDPRQ